VEKRRLLTMRRRPKNRRGNMFSRFGEHGQGPPGAYRMGLKELDLFQEKCYGTLGSFGQWALRQTWGVPEVSANQTWINEAAL
jgi:hypothetical protein